MIAIGSFSLSLLGQGSGFGVASCRAVAAVIPLVKNIVLQVDANGRPAGDPAWSQVRAKFRPHVGSFEWTSDYPLLGTDGYCYKCRIDEVWLGIFLVDKTCSIHCGHCLEELPCEEFECRVIGGLRYGCYGLKVLLQGVPRSLRSFNFN